MRLNSGLSSFSNGSSHSSRRNKMPAQVQQQLALLSTQNKKADDSNNINLNIFSLIDQVIHKEKCGMCLNSFHQAEMIRLCQCQHKFCFSCLNQYTIYKIDVGQQLLCPQEDCSQEIDQNGQIYMSLTNAYVERYRKQKLWRQTMKNPNTKICPQQLCKEGVVDLLKEPPQCRKCGTQYCSQCMMKAHKGACDKNFADKFHEWKRCPSCKLFINKIGGCNHIICRCNHQFCFVCLEDWNEDHYHCIDVRQLRGPLRDCMSRIPVISVIVLIISLPLFIAVLVAMCIAFLAISFVLGALGAPFAFFKQKNCTCWIVLIFLPFVMVGGGIGLMIFVLVMIYRPLIVRLFSVYFRMIRSLCHDAIGQ